MTARRRLLVAALCTATAAGALAAPASAQPAPAPAPAPSTLASYGYGETALRGTYGSAEVFVPLPDGERASGDAEVDLAFSHSPLLRPRSTLTVLAGGVAVGSARLTAENAAGGRLTARVPQALVGEEGVALSLRGFLRLTDDACEEADNPAQWVTVRPASRVRLVTEAVPRTLAGVEELLVGARPAPVEVQVAGADDPTLLAAAGRVAAQVGRWQGDARRDALVVPSAAAAKVAVAAGPGTPAGLPVRWSGSGYALQGGRTVPGEQGLLAVAPAGPPRLLVGGSTPDAVASAARALASPATATTLRGTVAPLTGERADPVARRSLPWHGGAATLAQLGYGRQDVVGLGVRELAVQVDRPAGWDVARGARLDLDVEASAALQERTSTVQVLLNGQSLGTRRLRPGAGPTTFRFALPEGTVDRRLDGRPLRALDLTVRFLLDLPQERCDPLQVEGARASLLPTTAFRLPHDTTDARELGRFPAPLAGSDGRVTVVLPESPDAPTLAAGLQVAAAVGRWSDPGSRAPALVTADRLTAAQRGGGLVLLGDADEQLGEAVDLGRSTVEPGPGEAVALLGMVPSPLDEDRTALVVHGDGPGLLLAARQLGSRTGLAALRGDHAALVGGGAAVALSGAPGEQPPAELAPVLGGPWYGEVRPYTVPAVVLLVGLLAGLGLVARHRWRRPARPRTAAAP